MVKFLHHFVVSFMVMLGFTITVKAQSNFLGYFEHGVELSYQVSPKYSHSFEIEERNVVYESDKLTYYVKQMDVAHLSEYQWHSKYAVGLGVKYRFKNEFDGDEENELRFQEQIVYSPDKNGYASSHRLRLEQRIYASVTKHRLRYKLSYKLPVVLPIENNPYLKLDTESLLELAKIQKPEFEQRLSASIEWYLNSKMVLQTGLEYRLSDYTHHLNHQLFIVAGLGISL